MRNIKTYDLVITALLIALTFLFTRVFNIRLPISINGGLIHLGNAMIVISAIVFGKKKCAVSAAFGMTLFDILSGWAIWAPFTFVIRFIMGYMLGAIVYSNKKKDGSNIFMIILAIIVSGIFMVFGYFVSDCILYSNPYAALTAIPGDIIQTIIGGAIGIPIGLSIKKYEPFTHFAN